MARRVRKGRAKTQRGPSERAVNVRDFITEYCTKEDGSPLSVEPWQFDWLQGVYPDPPDSERTVTRGLLTCGRKNGKTTFLAGVGIAHVRGPEAIPGTYVRTVATSRRQAGFLYEHMTRMVRGHEALSSCIEIKESTQSMTNLNNGVVFEVVATRTGALQGDNPALWIYDEIAEAKDLRIYDALDLAQGAVPGGGLGLVISTYTDEPGNPLGDLMHMVEKGQLNGGMKHWHKAIYSADPEADPYDWDNIKKANPNLGVSLSVASVKREIEEAKLLPAKRISFRARRLNLNVGNEASLCDPMVWKNAACDIPDYKMREQLEGEQVTMGLDLSDTKDLTALGLWWPDHDFASVDAWLPLDTLDQRSHEDRVPYSEWAEMGYLRTIPGPVIRHEVIFDRFEELAKTYIIRSLRFDRWRMAQLLTMLEARHVSITTDEFGQGYKDMAPAVEEFENRLLSGRLIHSDHPVLSMGIYNCKVAMNPTSLSAERKPSKGGSKHNRIDPAVALIMAIAVRGEKDPVKGADLFSTAMLHGDLEALARGDHIDGGEAAGE